MALLLVGGRVRVRQVRGFMFIWHLNASGNRSLADSRQRPWVPHPGLVCPGPPGWLGHAGRTRTRDCPGAAVPQHEDPAPRPRGPPAEGWAPPTEASPHSTVNVPLNRGRGPGSQSQGHCLELSSTGPRAGGGARGHAAGKPLPHCRPQARLSPVVAALHSHLTGLGASRCHQLSFRQATAPPLAQPSRRLKHMHKLNRHPDSTDIQSNLNDIH